MIEVKTIISSAMITCCPLVKNLLSTTIRLRNQRFSSTVLSESKNLEITCKVVKISNLQLSYYLIA